MAIQMDNEIVIGGRKLGYAECGNRNGAFQNPISFYYFFLSFDKYSTWPSVSTLALLWFIITT